MAAQEVLRRLGQRVRDLRVGAGLTQESLAERAGITWHFVSAIERGTKSATLETLSSLADALKVSLSELFLDVDRALPAELHRLESALAGREAGVQKAILRLVADAIALRDFEADEAPKLRAAEPRQRKR